MTPRAPARARRGSASPPARDARIRTGVGGWTFAPWRRNFYPAGLAQARELEYASRHLATIEINGTFYRAQKPAIYARWREETPAGFVFSLKAPRHATHRRVLAEAGRSIDAFVHGGIAELDDRLGPINWQFAPETAFDPADFAAFLARLPRDLGGRALRHVVEVRHPSFACAAFIELARGHGVATVFTDSPTHPSFADVTGDFVYARLMGSESAQPHGYPSAALDAWADRARAWARGEDPPDLPRVLPPAPAAPRDVFVYFIGAAKERNPAAAMALAARL
jgi:uncharacterized protein YecE (DUF72 family)